MNPKDVRPRRFSIVDNVNVEKLRCKYVVDLYSSTFFALTNEYKWKYSLTDAQIETHVAECFFVLFLQLFLTGLIAAQEVKDFANNDLINSVDKLNEVAKSDI